MRGYLLKRNLLLPQPHGDILFEGGVHENRHLVDNAHSALVVVSLLVLMDRKSSNEDLEGSNQGPE